jgi:acetyl-CoA C-acetyltransferase
LKVFILGAYQTKFGELWDKSLADLTAEAALGAIADAGIEKSRLQAAFFANKMAPEMTGQNHLGALLAEILGVNIPVTRIEAACASGGSAIREACLSINSGQYEAVLVVGAEKMTDLEMEKVAWGLMGAASDEERQAGLNFVGLYALMARNYFNQYGASEKDLACVAVKNHFHASLNPKAQFPFPITLENVLNSSLVADPLKLLDCSPISDGAAAAVLVSEKLPKKLAGKNHKLSAASNFQKH